MEGYQQGRGGGEWGKSPGNEKHKWLVQNRQGEVKNNIGNGEAKELICMTHGHELSGLHAVGRRVAGWRGIKGVKKWDNCNSIINKIYLDEKKISLWEKELCLNYCWFFSSYDTTYHTTCSQSILVGCMNYFHELFMNPVIIIKKTNFSAEKVRIDVWKCGRKETKSEGTLEIPTISDGLLHCATSRCPWETVSNSLLSVPSLPFPLPLPCW